MRDWIVIWDLEDDPDGHVQHIDLHGVTTDEVVEVLLDERNPVRVSRASSRPLVYGETSTGKFLAVAFEWASKDPVMVYPITAFETVPPESRRRKRRRKDR